MWETLHNNAIWDFFRSLTLPEILKTQNGPQGEFWKYSSYVCSHKLDVKEANFCFAQFNGWCRSANGWNFCSWSLRFGYWSVAFFFQLIKGIQRKCAVKPTAWHTIKKSNHTENQVKTQTQHNDLEFMHRRLCVLKREVFSIWCDAPHCWR